MAVVYEKTKLLTDKPLHYEIRIGSQSVDPAPILAGSSALYR